MSDCGKQQTPIQLQTQRKSLGLSEMGAWQRAPQNWASDFRREDTASLLLVTPRWGKETDSRLLKKTLQPRKAAVAARVNCHCCRTRKGRARKEGSHSFPPPCQPASL